MSITEAKERLNELAEYLLQIDAEKRYVVAIDLAIECMEKEEKSWK